VQTKTSKHQPANDSEDDYNSSIGSDSSMSVEAAPRALIWRNDTSSSKKGRKVSHIRNVSTIHSVGKSRRLSEKRDNDKPDSKASSEPEAVVPQAGQTAPSALTFTLVNAADIIDAVVLDTTTSRHSGGETPQGGGVPQVQSRGTKIKIRERTQVHSSPQPTRSRVRKHHLATRIQEWYHDCIPDEETTELPAQKGILRISDTDQAVQPRYLYDPDKDDRDLHFDQMIYEQAPRPYSLAEIIYEYDTEDEGRRGCQRDSDDHFHENHSHPLHQYLAHLEDGCRRRHVHTDTGDESLYSQWQPGLQLEEGNWSADYNYIRPSQSSI
jgi:hypothetical protein